MHDVNGAMHYGALYIRVSTDKQEELSPDAQRRLLLDYASSHNIFISPDLIFTENGISGRKADKRPEFQRMISLAKTDDPPFDVILVWKYSRFARNQEESIVYKSMLKKQHSIDVISITEPLAEGPFGSLIERIIEWMDEYYSINLSAEVTRGMTEKAMRGGYQTSPALGYAAPGHNQPFTVVPDEARIVQYIFDQYVNNHRDPTAIARALNERRLLTKRGNPFDRRSVAYILRNRFYIGKVIWNGIERDGVHETFVAPELFAAANDRLETTFRPAHRRNVSACGHWMSGLVKCSICGSSLAYNAGKYPYFHCWKYAKGSHPGSSCISERKLTAAVLDYFDRLLSGEDFALDYQDLSAGPDPADDVALYEKELEKMDMRMMRIREAYEAGVDSLEEYKENRQRLSRECDRLRELRDQAAAARKQMPEDAGKQEVLQKIRTMYDLIRDDDVNYETKGAFMRSLVEKIVWDKDAGTLSFYLYHIDNKGTLLANCKK